MATFQKSIELYVTILYFRLLFMLTKNTELIVQLYVIDLIMEPS